MAATEQDFMLTDPSMTTYFKKNYMLKQSHRHINLFGLLLCVLLLLVAAYLQFALHLQPCPLCIIQRIIIVALGLLFLVGALHIPPLKLWRRVHGAVIALVGSLGIATAARHIWLHHLPTDQIPPCGPGIDYLLQTLPLHQMLSVMLQGGTADCARDTWTLLYLTIPEWNILFFGIFTALGLWHLLRK